MGRVTEIGQRGCFVEVETPPRFNRSFKLESVKTRGNSSLGRLWFFSEGQSINPEESVFDGPRRLAIATFMGHDLIALAGGRHSHSRLRLLTTTEESKRRSPYTVGRPPIR